MVKVKTTLFLFVILSANTAIPALSGQIVYRPVNPSFGGDPLNSAHLLGIANAIDKYKDPNAIDPFSLLNQQSPQAALNDQLQQQVMQGVNGNAIDTVLSQNSGNYTLGSSKVAISPNADGQTRRIVLQNIDTGTQTIYDVPLASTGLNTAGAPPNVE
ncbi:curli assembly protein CsgF [Azospirillum rugosum]|uniref:Curli production assembly/transport component CsgF n=1 Tax=Azospirillum rugosum TaxID=416170 RepID=A0ABS4SP78_9PROT|nr:curli assembly protein CsgF [Azospirillum rugosum]MBP2294358.1 curli production assembly/transport component CsgF [Azospirillum rugosum]MDQ0527693.1 curli production assembly/transport component CsgF [Azospirillum rugosum]